MKLLEALAVLLAIGLLPVTADAWNRGEVERFATLPADAHNPEGITVDEQGNIYVTTFDITKSAGPGELLIFGPDGELLGRLQIEGSSNLLLGLAFHPITQTLLVIDFGQAQVLAVDPVTGGSSLFTTIPGGAAAGPNALTFDGAGNVYVSDSFQGVIWTTGPGGGVAEIWASSPLLATTGVPPFGANGLAFSTAGDTLFVCNTGNDTVVKIPVATRQAAVFVNSVNGCDGLIVDQDENLWAAANQADEIVVIDSSGRVIAKLGDFDGLNRHGAPIGLLFPASLVRSGHFIYVTNLALDLRAFGLVQPVDAQWAADVKQHTIARIRARIPRVKGLPAVDDSTGDSPPDDQD